MQIRFATNSDLDQVLSLFKENLSRENDAIYSEEFFCPFGVQANIKHNRIIVACEDNMIVAALRYYKRKEGNIASLYQYAIDVAFRGKGLLTDMLDLIRDNDIFALCPIISKFNSYYKKTGWKLKKSNDRYNHWVLLSKNKSVPHIAYPSSTVKEQYNKLKIPRQLPLFRDAL